MSATIKEIKSIKSDIKKLEKHLEDTKEEIYKKEREILEKLAEKKILGFSLVIQDRKSGKYKFPVIMAVKSVQNKKITIYIGQAESRKKIEEKIKNKMAEKIKEDKKYAKFIDLSTLKKIEKEEKIVD